MIEVINLKFSYSKKVVLSDINFKLKSGENLAILGENGSGKSTLLKCMLNLLPYSGEILLNGKNIKCIKRKDLSKQIAYIPQSQNLPFEYKVIDIVLMSRISHKSFFENYSKKDYKICEDALEKLGISHLKERIFTNLSGGEKQLVYLARAMSSKAKIIFMDEPVSGLDFGNQIKLLNLIKTLSNSGYMVVITSHHPRHVKFINSNVLMIKDRAIFKFGKAEILNEENIFKLYGIDYSKFRDIL